MRILVVVLLLGTVEAAPLLEDEAGDVRLEVNSEDAGTAPGGEGADLLGLEIIEGRDVFTFRLEVANVDGGTFSAMHTVHFQFATHAYRLVVSHFAGGGNNWRWTLYQDFEEGADLLANGQVMSQDGWIPVEVARGLVRDADGAEARPGTSLTGIHVASRADDLRFTINVPPAETSVGPSWIDDMGLEEPAVLPIAIGIEQSGHLRLASETPFRASNGEAASFVFHVTLDNRGSDDDLVTLSTSGLPLNWDVTLPAEVVRVADASQAVAVIVETPFAHAHGNTESFILEAHSGNDADAVGRVELGIHYPEVPQPAGHHDTLWFHSRNDVIDPTRLMVYALNEALSGFGSLQTVTMNAVEDHDLDDEVAAEARWDSFGGNGTTGLEPVFRWEIDLSPTLVMGLDFDTGRTGIVAAPIHTTLPGPARLQGELVWLGPPEGEGFTAVRQEKVLAAISSPWEELGIDGSATLEGTVQPTPDADFVPYQSGAGLRLDLRLAMDRPENFFLGPKADKPELLPGGWMQLPLLEYEDPVDEFFETGDLLSLDARTRKMLVNPGSAAAFHLNLTNHDEAPAHFRLRILGDDEGWAEGPDGIDVPAGQARDFTILVRAPEDAPDGLRADFVVEAASDRDADRALLRLVAEVDTDAEHEDASALDVAPADKDTPGAAAWLAGLLLVLLARSKRS